MPSDRVHRLQERIHAEISTLLRRDLRDPRLKQLSVSSVEVSRDLSHAWIRMSSFGDEEQTADGLAALSGAAGRIRSSLAQRLRVRRVPELHFDIDRGAEHALRIEQLLESEGPVDE